MISTTGHVRDTSGVPSSLVGTGFSVPDYASGILHRWGDNPSGVHRQIYCLGRSLVELVREETVGLRRYGITQGRAGKDDRSDFPVADVGTVGLYRGFNPQGNLISGVLTRSQVERLEALGLATTQGYVGFLSMAAVAQKGSAQQELSGLSYEGLLCLVARAGVDVARYHARCIVQMVDGCPEGTGHRDPAHF